LKHAGQLRTARRREVWAVDDDVWIYGHGAEYPDIDGWVPARNTSC
jgi:hypothetical protein